MEPGACMQVEPGAIAAYQRNPQGKTQYLLASSALVNLRKE